MDQPVCGHLDNHSPVARCDHVHAPESYLADTQDRPQVRHVPGKGTRDALNTHAGHFYAHKQLFNSCTAQLYMECT